MATDEEDTQEFEDEKDFEGEEDGDESPPTAESSDIPTRDQLVEQGMSEEEADKVVSDAEAQAAASDQAASASPTAPENTAGTPQSQLDLAPAMTDESGSNIPAPNLRQPLAEGARPSQITGSPDALDPSLQDPTKAAAERAEGRTSDAKTRAEGTHIDEVPADINTGTKPSDGGAEAYPFPQGGDVEVATVPEGSGEGEYLAPLEVEDAVILDDHELVPARLVGRRAFVVDAPRHLIAIEDKENTWITVRTRDEVNATISIPLSAVKEVQRGGVAAPLVRG